MSQQPEFVRLPISAWQVERLRLTAFPISAAPVTSLNWWAELMGQPPEAKVVHPRVGGQREQGQFLGGILANEVQPDRIDWLLAVNPEQEPKETGFPTIGPLTELLEPFVQLMCRWLEFDICPSLQRLAFGAILFIPVENRVKGYLQLQPYLPDVHLAPEYSSDFAYQINRPRSSALGIDGLKLNRLSKWSVVNVTNIRFEFAKINPTPGVFTNIGQESFGCRLELDINTTAQFQDQLPQDQLPRIFQELIDLGKEIATEGDIA